MLPSGWLMLGSEISSTLGKFFVDYLEFFSELSSVQHYQFECVWFIQIRCFLSACNKIDLASELFL